MSEHQQNQTVTELKSIKFRREWNFKVSVHETDYTSLSFTVRNYGNGEWSMNLGVDTDYDRCSLHLCLNDKPKFFSINLTFQIRNRLYPEHSFSKTCFGLLKKENGFQSFIDFRSLEGMRNVSEMVYIVCEAELKPVCVLNVGPQFHIPACDLSHDFESLYNDERTADVTLTVADKKFHAHRVILTARSSVFAAMFRNNMKETITKNVDITDLDAVILEHVLRFIYTDQIPDLKENAIDLLDAADKYDLQKLKAMCEKTLYQNVDVESVAEILVMADRHRAPQLKTQAVRFIKFHMKEVIKTGGYKNLKEHHPGLIVELFEAVATLSN